MVGKGRKGLLAGKTTAAAAAATANKEKDNKKRPISRSCRVELQINSMSTVPRFVKNSLEDDVSSSEASLSGWSSINEPVGISSKKAFMKLRLLEQINTKTDKSDYMWCSLSTEVKGNVPFLEDGSQTVLHVQSIGHVLYSFVNGKLAGPSRIYRIKLLIQYRSLAIIWRKHQNC